MSYNPGLGSAVGHVILAGNNGFSLDATPHFGVTTPSVLVSPGETVFMRAFWSSNDLPGTATLAGETFTRLGGPDSVNSVMVDFLSTPFTLPDAGSLGAVTFTVPFTLTGTFRGAPGTGIGVPLPTVDAVLFGTGIGIIPFTWVGPLGVDGWDPGIARFEISAPATPVPEPGTATLLGLGVVVGAARRRLTRRLR